MEQEFSYSLQPRRRCAYKCMDLPIRRRTNTTLWLFSCSCANGWAGYEKWFFTCYPLWVGRSSPRNAKVYITLVSILEKETQSQILRPHVMYIIPVGQNPTGAVNMPFLKILTGPELTCSYRLCLHKGRKRYMIFASNLVEASQLTDSEVTVL